MRRAHRKLTNRPAFPLNSGRYRLPLTLAAMVLWLPLILLSLAQESSRAAESGPSEPEPRKVFVTVSDVQLHSGPSEDFYPTAILKKGAVLSVYQQSEDGWLGVRPPAGSFSWVAASDAFLLPGGKVIEITNETAVSWIGTQLGSAKQYRWQVQLQRGEQLAVVGEATRKTEDGKPVLWYRIAPPSGEFRWLQASAVSPVPEHVKTKIRKQSGNSSSAVTTASYDTEEIQGEIVLESGSAIPSSSEYYGENGVEFSEEFVDGEFYDTQYGQGEWLDGELAEGEYIVGGPYEEGMVGGDYYDDAQIIEGEVIGAEPMLGGGPSRPAEHFEGWHAMQFSFGGLNLPWLSRVLNRRQGQTGYDPLKDDPFSLAIPSRPSQGVPNRGDYAATAMMNSPPVMSNSQAYREPDIYAPEMVDRGRGWRDPRTIRGGAGSGHAGSSTRQPAVPHLAPVPDDSASIHSRRSNSAPPSTALELAQERMATMRETIERKFGPGAPAANSPPANDSQPIFRPAENAPYTPPVQQISASLSEYGGGGRRPAGMEQVDWYGLGANGAVSRYEPLQLGSSGLTQLQLALGEMVASPMQNWNLVPLATEAERYISVGSTAVERGQARLLLERIDAFRALAARSGYTQFSPSVISNSYTSPSNWSGNPVASASFSTPVANSMPSSGTSYDSTGWLVPVHAAVAGQPNYALTDDSGKILTYVSPLPGMKLDLYLNQAVGITGLKGYLPQLQAGNIQAHRVSRLR